MFRKAMMVGIAMVLALVFPAQALVYKVDFKDSTNWHISNAASGKTTVSDDGTAINIETVAWFQLDKLPKLSDGFTLSFDARQKTKGNWYLKLTDSNNAVASFQFNGGTGMWYKKGAASPGVGADGAFYAGEDVVYRRFAVIASKEGLYCTLDGTQIRNFTQADNRTGGDFDLTDTVKIEFTPENASASLNHDIANIVIENDEEEPTPPEPTDDFVYELNFEDTDRFVPDTVGGYSNDWTISNAGTNLTVNTVGWFHLGNLPEFKTKMTLSFDARNFESQDWYLKFTDGNRTERSFQLGKSGIYYRVGSASVHAVGAGYAFNVGEDVAFKTLAIVATKKGFYLTLDGAPVAGSFSKPADVEAHEDLAETDNDYLLGTTNIQFAPIGATTGCKHEIRNVKIVTDKQGEDPEPPEPQVRVYSLDFRNPQQYILGDPGKITIYGTGEPATNDMKISADGKMNTVNSTGWFEVAGFSGLRNGFTLMFDARNLDESAGNWYFCFIDAAGHVRRFSIGTNTSFFYDAPNGDWQGNQFKATGAYRLNGGTAAAFKQVKIVASAKGFEFFFDDQLLANFGEGHTLFADDLATDHACYLLGTKRILFSPSMATAGKAYAVAHEIANFRIESPLPKPGMVILVR